MIASALFFGLGRIGLPQSLVFANAGISIYGYDIDPWVIASLNAGELPFNDIGMEALYNSTRGKTFFPISSWHDILPKIDAAFFTLGTSAPDAEKCLQNDDCDIEHIKSLLVELLVHPLCKNGLLLVFRATLGVGSTDRLKAHVEEETDLKEGVDFHMCFVPERLMEGVAIREEQTLPKIIGAFNDIGFTLAKNVFERIGGKIIRVSNPRTAEFCKLTDNSYRNTRFAFANELAMWASRQGVDVQEVIRASNDEYQRNNIPLPGFVSGYCLGKDPYIFEYGFNNNPTQRDFQSLWYYGRRANDFLYDFVVDELLKALDENGYAPAAAKVAILGLSFKEDVGDFRMSHAFMLIDILSKLGITQIVGYDPNLDSCKYTRIPAAYPQTSYQWVKTLDPENFAGVHAVIIAHRHRELRQMSLENIKATLAQCASPVVVYDGWNIWRAAQGLAGLKYHALGL